MNEKDQVTPAEKNSKKMSRLKKQSDGDVLIKNEFKDIAPEKAPELTPGQRRIIQRKVQMDIKLERDIKLVKTYVFENCIKSAIDYKKTTDTWIKEISDWSGCDISREALITCFDKFTINSREIVKGINVYGLKTKK